MPLNMRIWVIRGLRIQPFSLCSAYFIIISSYISI